MSREIKFRFYDQYLKEMSYYTLEELLDGKFYLLHLHNGNLKGSVHPMQYIGFKDNKGKDIYEGDIIKHKHAFRSRVVEMEGGALDYSPFKYYTDPVEDYIVEGNIYENPDLWEQAQ